MRKVNNITALSLWGVGEELTYRNEHAQNPVMQELRLVSVGPCAVFIVPPTSKGKDDKLYLLGVFEGDETFQFAFPAFEYKVIVDPSGPVYYASPTGEVAQDVGEVKSFTRLEKPGLYMDELGIALHRQAVLSRISAARENVTKDAYQRQLERQLAELSEQVAALTPRPPVKPAPAPDSEGAE